MKIGNEISSDIPREVVFRWWTIKFSLREKKLGCTLYLMGKIYVSVEVHKNLQINIKGFCHPYDQRANHISESHQRQWIYGFFWKLKVLTLRFIFYNKGTLRFIGVETKVWRTKHENFLLHCLQEIKGPEWSEKSAAHFEAQRRRYNLSIASQILWHNFICRLWRSLEFTP